MGDGNIIARGIEAALVRLYLLGLEINYGLNDFRQAVDEFQHTGDDDLVRKMENLAARIPLLIAEFNELGESVPLCKDAVEFERRCATSELESNLWSLNSIRNDPSMYIKPSFRVYSPAGPKQVLETILQVTTESGDGGTLTDSQYLSFSFQLYCADLYDEIGSELYPFYANEQPLNQLLAEDILADLMGYIAAYPEVQKYTAKMLQVFDSLVKTFTDLDGMEAQEMSDSDDYEDTSYFRQLNHALAAITEAIADLRKDLLQELAATI